jgi:hypothetical protein
MMYVSPSLPGVSHAPGAREPRPATAVRGTMEPDAALPNRNSGTDLERAQP